MGNDNENDNRVIKKEDCKKCKYFLISMLCKTDFFETEKNVVIKIKYCCNRYKKRIKKSFIEYHVSR